jgi:nicotinate-nucleotide adenylyltransferase
VHRGHLAVARAAAKQFKLDLIYFAPADIPPHKQKRKLTDFRHRFAMLTPATAGEKRFVPSLIDAPTGRPNYSVDTVRRLKSSLGKRDKLYFLIGMDAFKDIRTWRKPVQLLTLCDFIVARRPGHSLADVGRALPLVLRPHEDFLRALETRRLNATIALLGVTIHLLDEVNEPVSSTQIRAAAKKSTAQLSRLVPQSVAEYIRKEGLYTNSTRAKTSKK